MKKVLMAIIRFYQRFISPLFGTNKCRYYPCCSQYALEALELHGFLKGSVLTIRRLLRCNVFFPGGVDPVPPKKEKHNLRK